MPRQSLAGLYKPVTITNALFIRLGKEMLSFLKTGLSYEGGWGPLVLTVKRESILFPSQTLPVALMSLLVLISNTLLQIFLA